MVISCRPAYIHPQYCSTMQPEVRKPSPQQMYCDLNKKLGADTQKRFCHRRGSLITYAAKELHFNRSGEALKRMQAGVDKLASVVGVTLGPKVITPIYTQAQSSWLFDLPVHLTIQPSWTSHPTSLRPRSLWGLVDNAECSAPGQECGAGIQVWVTKNCEWRSHSCKGSRVGGSSWEYWCQACSTGMRWLKRRAASISAKALHEIPFWEQYFSLSRALACWILTLISQLLLQRPAASLQPIFWGKLIVPVSTEALLMVLVQAAQKTNDIAGDGTTTATILSAAIIAEGMKIVAAGTNPIQLTRGIEKTVTELVKELTRISVDVTDDDLINVATVSAGGNEIVSRPNFLQWSVKDCHLKAESMQHPEYLFPVITSSYPYDFFGMLSVSEEPAMGLWIRICAATSNVFWFICRLSQWVCAAVSILPFLPPKQRASNKSKYLIDGYGWLVVA